MNGAHKQYSRTDSVLCAVGRRSSAELRPRILHHYTVSQVAGKFAREKFGCTSLDHIEETARTSSRATARRSFAISKRRRARIIAREGDVDANKETKKKSS